MAYVSICKGADCQAIVLEWCFEYDWRTYTCTHHKLVNMRDAYVKSRKILR